MTAPRATVYDVAREAGVSIKTVSRVVNGAHSVAEPTRERVLQAVRRLRYVPNSNALSLKAGGSRTVGVVVDSLADPFFASIVAVVERKLAAVGYTVLVAATNRDAEREREQVTALTSHRIAGLVLAPAPGDHHYLQDTLHDIPVVLVDRVCDIRGYDVIRVDDTAIAQRAVAGLLETGHRRIGFIGDSTTLPTSIDRYNGYLAAHAEAEVPTDSTLERWQYEQPDEGAEAVRSLLAMENPPTAIFCAHPRSTAGAVRALQQTGNTDRALIGFGDVQLGDVVKPGLTVVDHRPELIAEPAADLLLAKLAAAQAAPSGTTHQEPTTVLIDIPIVRRGSGELTPCESR